VGNVAVRTGKLNQLVGRLGEVTESIEKHLSETKGLVDRLIGSEPEPPTDAAHAPAVALLGGLEDLVERLERVAANLSHANQRLADAA
jgi:hypothetical protein